MRPMSFINTERYITPRYRQHYMSFGPSTRYDYDYFASLRNEKCVKDVDAKY